MTEASFGWRYVAYQASVDLVPFYPLYAVLFADSGLSEADIAVLLTVWMVAGLLLEVPSGALADTLSRRRLLMAGTTIRAIGFTLWVVWPTMLGFAIGFVLWALEEALNSGTSEALLYDELAAVGAEDNYQRWAARTHTAALAAQLVATVSAAPLFAWGGYALIAAVSAGAGLVGVALIASMPERPRVEKVDGGWRRWVSMLRSGTGEASRSPWVRRRVLIYAVLVGCTALDEAFPLLAVEVGVATALVPLVIGATVLGQLTGSALGGRRMSDQPLALVLLIATAMIVGGALARSVWGFVPITLGYGALQYGIVLADARLQESVEGPARATVTSVAGLGAGFAALAAYGLWGVVAENYDNGFGVGTIALFLLPAVLLLALGRPAPSTR